MFIKILDDKYVFSGQSEYKVPLDGTFKEHEGGYPTVSDEQYHGAHVRSETTCCGT